MEDHDIVITFDKDEPEDGKAPDTKSVTIADLPKPNKIIPEIATNNTRIAPTPALIMSSGINDIGAVGYIKTIQRRGNTYMVRESLSSEDDPVESNGADHMINDLYIETLQMSSSAGRTAQIFKFLYLICTLFIIIGGVIIGVFTIQGLPSEATRYVSGVFGFVISGLQAILTTFSIEKRGVLLKDVSAKLRTISRQLKILQNSEMKHRDKMKKLEEYYAQVDDLDMSIFDNNITTSPVTEVTKISQRGNSDINSNDSDTTVPPTGSSLDSPKSKFNLRQRFRSSKNLKPKSED